MTKEELLIEAAKSGYLDVVEFFVKSGTDIHALGEYAFCNAAGNGHLEVVKFLVSKCSTKNTKEEKEANNDK
jgi:ankyrin repeat protein